MERKKLIKERFFLAKSIAIRLLKYKFQVARTQGIGKYFPKQQENGHHEHLYEHKVNLRFSICFSSKRRERVDEAACSPTFLHFSSFGVFFHNYTLYSFISKNGP
jgi:hypothetical protein